MALTSSFEALKKAIEFERGGIDYYKAAAKKAKNPGTRALFGMLVKEEEKHERFLESLRVKLRAEDKWPQGITIDIDVDFKLLFQEESKKIDRNVKVETSEIEALSFALEMENKGRRMYLGLSGKASNDEEKELYKKLADWEEGHVRFVQDFHDYYEDHGMFTGE